MFRRLTPRFCTKVPQQAAAAAATTTAAAAPRKAPRSFEAADEPVAPNTAQNAADFPTQQQPASSSSPLPNDDDPQLSEAARRKIAIVNEIGDQAFEENTAVLKNIALRGMRSGLIIVVGAVAFIISLKKKKRRDAAFDEEERAKAAAQQDPTQRYLEEMSGLGFDTEQGEIDAAEARKKALAAQAAAAVAAQKK